MPSSLYIISLACFTLQINQPRETACSPLKLKCASFGTEQIVAEQIVQHFMQGSKLLARSAQKDLLGCPQLPEYRRKQAQETKLLRFWVAGICLVV